MYLRISNRGSLNRKFLELIGFTTKRDRVEDVSVIGNKGSGTKLAAVAALRLGLRLAIASSDYLGRYVLTFDVEEVDIDGTKAKQIVLDYRTIAPQSRRPFIGKAEPSVVRQRHPWSMTVDAFQDWDKPIGNDEARAFKVLREFVCNAYDEDKSFGLSLGSKVEFAKPGHTVVYLKYDETVRRVVQTEVAKYFKFMLKDPKKFVVPGVGEIFAKSDDKLTRLFLQGVLVECSDSYYRRSIYDYSLYDKTLLSEERTIKSWDAYKRRLGNLLAGVTDQGMVTAILENAVSHKAELEASALGTVASVDARPKAVWQTVIVARYGTASICLPSGNPQIDNDAQQIYGYRVVSDLPDSIRPFFRTLGYKGAQDLVPQQPEYERVRLQELDGDSRQRFRRAFRLFAKHFPSRAELPIVFFYAKDEKVREKILGYAGIGEKSFKEIWIAAKSPTTLASELDIFETLVHEGRHVETQAGDYDRTFVHQAEKDTTIAVLRADGRDSFPDGSVLPEMGDPDSIVPNLVDPDEVDIEEVDDDDVINLDAMLDELLEHDIVDPEPE